MTIGENNFPDSRVGTSFAAPQVSGLAALLMDRNADLEVWPTAVKAIIMASAVHNIEGESRLSDKDGAGSIDAALADQIAQVREYGTTCDAPCWWGIPTYNTSPVVGGSINRYLYASRGERIRVAISWWSNADPPIYPAPGNLARDELDTNYNLYVYNPGGGLVDSSISKDNNYELVEFVASETGIHRIRVYRSSSGDSNEAGNRLGIAWVKDATYLPDLRNKDGWVSELLVCNEGSQPRSWQDDPQDPVYIYYFEPDGDPTPYGYDRCNLNPNQCCGIYVNWSNRIPYGTTGSAIVSGGEDVSVVVKNLYNSGGRYLAAAYPGETAPATTVYAPYVVKKWPTGHPSWWQTTDLIIQNTGSQQALVTITFYDSWGGYSGSGSHGETRTIPANGQITLSGTEMPTWEGSLGTLASAIVTSDQPVAVVARTYTGVANSSGVIVTPYLAGSYRAFTSGADEVYMPVVGREYYNYDSSIQVQNTRNGDTTFQITYYRLGQIRPVLTLTRTVGAYRSMNFWRPGGLPANYLGTAVIEVTSGGPVVAMAQYDHVDTSQDRYGVNQYEGVTSGTRSDVLPHVQRTSSTWPWTGIMVQNMGESTTNVTLEFYSGSGSSAGSLTKDDVYPGTAALYWESEIPSTSASAVASSDPAKPLGLMINFDRLGDGSWTNKDGMMGYGAVK